MDLSRFPRRRYTSALTPLHPLPRLSAWLGGPTVWLKRDDLTGLTAGGNKTRKLEFLVADALEAGADTLVTGGSVQSNHCRLTLSAAIAEGLRCHLVLQELVPGSFHEDASGNHFLYRLLGADGITVIDATQDRAATMEHVAEQIRADGGRPYVVPTGGSNAIGTLGYVACAQEILQQSFEMGVSFDHVICASSSGGTHAGLATGLAGVLPVTGVAVEHAEDQEAMVHDLCGAVSRHLGIDAPPRSAVQVLEGYVGEGYSLPTEAMREAVQQFARLEGVLLDPVYTGKTAAGVIGLIRQSRFGNQDNVVLLHTGGSPALFQYRDDVL